MPMCALVSATSTARAKRRCVGQWSQATDPHLRQRCDPNFSCTGQPLRTLDRLPKKKSLEWASQVAALPELFGVSDSTMCRARNLRSREATRATANRATLLRADYRVEIAYDE